jgi:hypothetical protein
MLHDCSFHDFCKLEHYTCMVELVGHAGHLQEAENMVKVIPVNQM